ncbi:MAG TPA: hypothetical protein VHF50_07215 [Solirubrobacterales bacterium]|nr:hypothetical protein [Solirubrobacterales bacterium]
MDVNPNTGHIYVADQALNRIAVFDAWGGFLRAWGWDVVESGPGDDVTAPEDQFEICVPANGDVCKSGIGGTGTGQIEGFPRGLALDSTGNVYAAETHSPRRVQKFSPTGEFLRMWGGDVVASGPNDGGTSGAEVCVPADGDVCQPGDEGTGPGEFSGATMGPLMAISSDDKVYVGDVNRVQRFDTAGMYQGEIAVPGETVQQLAVDGGGFLYLSYQKSPVFPQEVESKPDVYKVDPATGNPVLTFPVNHPRAIAVASNGEVYVFDSQFAEATTRIRRFSATGNQIEAFGEGLSAASTGIAVSTACGIEGVAVYHADFGPPFTFGAGFVRAYSNPPDLNLCPRPPLAPEIADQHARSVGVVDATVGAQINPRFREDTIYYVEYGTEACLQGGWSGPCVERELFPGVTLTSEIRNSPVLATAGLNGLSPETAYRFRFVASSSGGGPTFGDDGSFVTFPANPPPSTACANQDRRGGLSALLPDCRAYEMVSPVDKNGGDIRSPFNISTIEQFYPQARPDGNKFTYSAGVSFGGGAGNPFVSQYMAHRGGVGWTSENITPGRRENIAGGAAAFLENQFIGFGDDLCTAWMFWDGNPPLGEEPFPGIPDYMNLYRRDICTSGGNSFTSLIRGTPPNAPGGDPFDNSRFNPFLVGASADGAHAVYSANDALPVGEGPPPNPGTPGLGSNRQLYELYDDGGSGKVRLVSVLPNGTASSLRNRLGNADTYEVGNARHAVSADGETIYWTGETLSGSDVITAVIYARIGGEETVPVSPTNFGQRATFEQAAADGSAVLFSMSNGSLRRFDLASETMSTIASGFRGLIGASDDLERAYFVSTNGTLDPSPNPARGAPQAGRDNLYLYERGEAGPTFTFIATLASGDLNLTANRVHSRRASRVSPSGLYLVFASRGALTGRDNTDLESGAADSQVFRYSMTEDRLDCASCNPSGARPKGVPKNGILGRGNPSLWPNVAGILPGHEGLFRVDWALSEDGQRLFFESFDALLPRDTNSNRDVYQWEALGKGECDSDNSNPGPLYFPQNGGCLALITTGKADGDADFLEATPSGSDVFFRTDQSLLAQDPDLLDIYDARINGGFAPPPPGAAACEGDACQAPARTPSFPTPSSSAFEGSETVPTPGPSCRFVSTRAKRLRAVAKRLQGTKRAAGARKRARRATRKSRSCLAKARATNSSRGTGR